VRLSVWNAKRELELQKSLNAAFSLTHQDLSCFAIELMKSSTGDLVKDLIEAITKTTGIVPLALISDQGADVRRGAELFSQVEGRKTVVVFDIAHAVANAIKRLLNKSVAWQKFLSDANHFKTKVRQTSAAFLMPPELKNKARWMNLEPLIGWSRRVEAFLAAPQAGLEKAEVDMDLETLQQKLEWLAPHYESIASWSKMMDAAGIILQYTRNQGYHDQACAELQPLLSEFQDGPARGVADECLEFIREQSEKCPGQRLLGSSEILESLIGKGKQIQGHNKNGYTKSILGMAAAVSQRSDEVIEAALATVKNHHVTKWVKDNLGLSIQSQRERALPALQVGTKTG
jgi:hypothetical protein